MSSNRTIANGILRTPAAAFLVLTYGFIYHHKPKVSYQLHVCTKESKMDPYEADPNKISKSDRYADRPLFGRYKPRIDDFHPNASRSFAQVDYWDNVLSLCNESNRIRKGFDGARDVFAVGSLIIHSAHLQPVESRGNRRYNYRDANEVAAISVVRKHFQDFQVPVFYFQGKLRGSSVLIQKRMEGVGLNVAWDHLTQAQKEMFKKQTRKIISRLDSLKDSRRYPKPSYVLPDPHPIRYHGIDQLECDLLFTPTEGENDNPPGLAHNNLKTSNIIVKNDSIVAIIGWEMAGFLGRTGPRNVHEELRTPTRSVWENVELPKEYLEDILFWNDLYDYED